MVTRNVQYPYLPNCCELAEVVVKFCRSNSPIKASDEEGQIWDEVDFLVLFNRCLYVLSIATLVLCRLFGDLGSLAITRLLEGLGLFEQGILSAVGSF